MWKELRAWSINKNLCLQYKLRFIVGRPKSIRVTIWIERHLIKRG